MKRLSGTVSYHMSRHRYSESQFLKFSVKHKKTGLISICLLRMDVQPSTKSYQLQEGGEGAKQPLTSDLPMDHAGVSAPIPPVIGFMA